MYTIADAGEGRRGRVELGASRWKLEFPRPSYGRLVRTRVLDMGYLPLANIPYLLLIRGSHEPEDALTPGKPTAESSAESNTNSQNKQTTTEFSTRG